MTSWDRELNELDRILKSFKGHIPDIVKELEQLIKTDDPNVVLLYSRRCLEVIITDLCEAELKRPRKTEPLKGIIDKLNSEELVPSHIIASMHSLNSMSTYGTHPKDFDPEQVKPVLINLSIIIKWYLKYKDFQILSKSDFEDGRLVNKIPIKPIIEDQFLKKRTLFGLSGVIIVIIVVIFIVIKLAGGEEKNLDKNSQNQKKTTSGLQIPSVSTNNVTSYTSTNATIGGNMISDEGVTVTDRGVYWGTTQNPESSGTKLQIGSGIGSFSTILPGLIPNTTYYIKAYAINIRGTGYGQEVNFTTQGNSYVTTIKESSQNDGSIYFIDSRDNKRYKMVKIGNQTWMAENLKAITLYDGMPIPLVTDANAWSKLTTPGYCYYNNNEAISKSTYGVLYNWYTLNTGKLCPLGWHAPSDDEWMILSKNLEGNSVNSRKLKQSGFNILLGGSRDYQGNFYNFGQYCTWWSTLEGSEVIAWIQFFDSESSSLKRGNGFKQSGYFVRCIKDN